MKGRWRRVSGVYSKVISIHSKKEVHSKEIPACIVITAVRLSRPAESLFLSRKKSYGT
jgi:hypothetical protein